MSDSALFISDLHLHPSRPGATVLFQQFLSDVARDKRADDIYILGDLFDSWAGDDDLSDPFNAQMCTNLCRCAAGGVRLHFIPGNRDFLVGSAFAQATGMTILSEPIVKDIAGTPTLLLHGDLLCTDDAEYQQFRSTVRGEAWQQDFLGQPLAQRKAIIEGLRSRSEAEKQVKSMAIMDVNATAVADAFRAYKVARMIHGHTHRQAEHRLQIDGRDCIRWVLGDWHEDAGNALLCDGSGCRFVALCP
ncbi:MAG TPA: UDP-2,3-diacylglucosamine diphosphatase [Rhodocyclaceae bacterium]|nr:UDP-2,3-diacylglucosamine diphosphatase [Rhodocyclaceae bacterium]